MCTKYIRSESVVTREVAEETIVVPVRGGVGDLDGLFTFNEIGSGIWRMLSDSKSVEELTRWVRENYEVSGQQAEEDVGSFLEQLEKQGLVRAA